MFARKEEKKKVRRVKEEKNERISKDFMEENKSSFHHESENSYFAFGGEEIAEMPEDLIVEDEIDIGSRVRCRDFGEEWKFGIVTQIFSGIAKVQVNGTIGAHFWDEVELLVEEETHARFFVLQITEVFTGSPAEIQRILEENDYPVDVSIDIDDLKPGYHDVIIVPGGSASFAQFRIGTSGEEKIRKFVHEGGGYVGFCAGAYLGSKSSIRNKKEQRLGLLNANWTSKPTSDDIEGHVTLEFETNDFFQVSENITCEYRGGTFWERENLGENCFPIGSCVRGVEGFENFMNKKLSIIGGTYGKGKVILCGPHPETTPNLENFACQLITSVAPEHKRSMN